MQQHHNIWLFDNRKPGSQEPGEWEFKLKATKNCRIESKASRGWFKSSCDTDHGDSGGPYFMGNTLYGIVSGGRSGFDDKTKNDLGVRPERFASDLQKMTKNSVMPATNDSDVNKAVDTAPENELEQKEADLNNRVQKISDMTDGDFFDFLRDATDYQILKENYEAARAREQSTANKLLGGLAIGATGIGGMQMASAIAEQNADADAERDMRAYLATFHCNYGGGKNVKYGETNVELPGGNDLIALYTEYVNLANDLKVRKAALDMPPGIESEPILESATSGLYDDIAVGKTSGAYTSLSRAILDPNGADAAAWAKQKEDTASKKNTGTIVGGVGAVGSAVGNLIINRDKDKKE